MRKLYKLIVWDYGTNSGIATDGTKFEGEPIEFPVAAADLDEVHNGHLEINEIFSADEDFVDHHLYNIVIEQGPRKEAEPLHRRPVAAVDEDQLPSLESTLSEINAADPNGNKDERVVVDSGKDQSLVKGIDWTPSTRYDSQLPVLVDASISEESEFIREEQTIVRYRRRGDKTVEERLTEAESQLISLWTAVRALNPPAGFALAPSVISGLGIPAEPKFPVCEKHNQTKTLRLERGSASFICLECEKS